MVMTMILGCLGNDGQLRWDHPQLTSAFENLDLQKDFNYYYDEVGNWTVAIAGISPAYNMKPKMWREVKHDTDEVRDLVSRAWEDYAYRPHSPCGAHILNPEEKQVGNWYSSLRFVTVKSIKIIALSSYRIRLFWVDRKPIPTPEMPSHCFRMLNQTRIFPIGCKFF